MDLAGNDLPVGFSQNHLRNPAPSAFFAASKMKLLKNLFNRSKKKKTKEKQPPDFLHVQVDLAYDQYSEAYRKLKKAVMKKPRILDVELTFCTDLSPAFCLLCYELLTSRKHPRTTVHTTCRYSLRDGALLLILAGEKRFVSPFCFFELTDLQKVRRNQPDDHKAHLFREDRFGTSGEHTFCTHYAYCLSIISKYIPITELTGKRYNCKKTLGRYGLLADESSALTLFEGEEICQETFALH